MKLTQFFFLVAFIYFSKAMAPDQALHWGQVFLGIGWAFLAWDIFTGFRK